MSDANDELLHEAQKGLHVRSIYLRTANVELNGSFYPDITPDGHPMRLLNAVPQPLEHNRLAKDGGNDLVEYRVLFAVQLFPTIVSEEECNPENVEKRLASLMAIYAAFYEVKSPLTEEHLLAFGKKNAAFHIWPYWREMVNSTFGRMSLPGVLIPMMHRLRHAPKPTGKEDSQTPASEL